MTHHSENQGAAGRQGKISRRDVLARTAAAGVSAPLLTSAMPNAVGASAQATPPAGSEIDRVVMLQGSGVRFFDPTRRFSSTDANPNVNIYDTLVRFDKSLDDVQPALATAWEAIDDTTWQFNLREGVTFHNGEPFNADTVVAWFERMQNLEELVPGAASAIDQFPLVDRIEKVDDLTVNFVTSAPSPTLLRRLTTYYALIPPTQYFEEEGPDALADRGIGTGAYRFVEWVQDSHILLEANPDYWGGEPKVKELEFRTVPEASARVSSLLAGEAQIAERLPLSGVQQAEGNESIEVRTIREATRVYWCQFNATGNEYLQNVQVRQALNHAVDKQAIVDTILGGYATQLNSVVSAECFGYAEMPEYEYDPDRARELLAEAGYPDGFSVTLNAAIGRATGDSEIIQAIIDFLGEVGVSVEFQQIDFANYLTLLRNEEVEGMTFGGKTIPALDADYMFNELQPGKTFGWLFPLQGEAQELFQEERTEMDDTRRAELCAEIQQWYNDEAGILFLWQMDLLYGVDQSLNWQPRGDGLVLGREMAGA